jgi:Kef-type K+ transport system membrane component KefB/nucleotide-binding universal stress UspA family protein
VSPLILLLLQIAAIVAVGRLLGRLARTVRQPGVVAEILAGILLGPSLLGALWPAAQAALFPAGSLAVLHEVAGLGLVLFMFIVGIEFDPGLLRGRGWTPVRVGLVSFAAPFALGAMLAVSVDQDRGAPADGRLIWVLFWGVAMSITAFPVLARILAERKLLRSRLGALTLACAAINDVTGWCVLAFVVAAARTAGASAGLWTTGLAAAYAAAMLLLVRPLMARIGSRSGEGLSLDRVALVLVLLFASAAATEAIGIHALFGAFLFGAIQPRTGGFAKAIVEKLETPVTVALLPLFFAYSGLRTEIGLISTAGDLALFGTIVAVAASGMIGGSAIAARWSGIPWREAGALGALLNTRGLMELIVLNIGLDLGVIPPKIFTMMVLMALVTTLMTNPLLHWLHPRRRAAMESAGRDPRRPEGGGVLLCVADPRVGPAMATLAGALEGGRTIQALHLMQADRASAFLLGGEPRSDALDPLLGRARALGLDIEPLAFFSNAPAADICAVAEARRVDLVVMGVHRPLIGRSFLGGVVGVVLESPCSAVALLLDRGLHDPRRVLWLDETGEAGAAAGVLAKALEQGGRVAVERVAVDKGSGPDRALLTRAAGFDLVVLALRDPDSRTTGRSRETWLQECPTSVAAVAPAATCPLPPPR